jgi:hypothetical protein
MVVVTILTNNNSLIFFQSITSLVTNISKNDKLNKHRLGTIFFHKNENLTFISVD